MKKCLLSLIIFVFSSNITISANSYSIFGGTYDYDDDNTTNLFGLNFVKFPFDNVNSGLKKFDIITLILF